MSMRANTYFPAVIDKNSYKHSNFSSRETHFEFIHQQNRKAEQENKNYSCRIFYILLIYQDIWPLRSMLHNEELAPEQACTCWSLCVNMMGAVFCSSAGGLRAWGHTLLPLGRVWWTGVGGASELHLIMYRKHLKN